jgi:2-polyprenyl-3-methyl-5-hydroxy-6-metoxy-1,4-benzoquinol methylase
MKELFSLGDLYVSDFIKDENTFRGGKHEMKLMFDEKTAEVRLEKSAPPDAMYGKYWYRSGINDTMKNELASIVSSIQSVKKLKPNSVWLDIACNDGTLLSFVPNTMYRVGIDPVEDSYKKESEKHANLIIQDYFSLNAIKNTEFEGKKADVITCIAMFYDLENRDSFLQDVRKILHQDGLFVLQLSYTPLMIEQMAFDNICHEHIYYYTLTTMRNLLGKNGFKIVDCQLNDVNGGSFRLYVMHDMGNVNTFGTQPYRDVCNFRKFSLMDYERRMRYNTENVWQTFYLNLLKLRAKTYNFIKEEKEKGKKIWGYGASTKGNTLLQYFGLNHLLIDGIAERSHYKFGLKTVGTNIPIYSEEDMRAAKPDYLLILPWHFINEFKEREIEFLKGGGKMIVPCPRFNIITIDDVN